MAAPTKELVRTLAAFKGAEGNRASAAVISLYLDVDGSRFVRTQDYQQQFEQLLRTALERPDVKDDAQIIGVLRKMQEVVKAGFDRSHIRGVAFFGSTDNELWEVVELSASVHNQLVVNTTPHVRQLERAVEDPDRFAVLLVDKQRARLFVFAMGMLVERSEVFDELPRGDDEKGDRDRGESSHTDAVVHHHIRHAATVAFDVYQQQKFDHLIVGGPQELLGELERELHSYLRDRVAAHVDISTQASDSEILDAALQVERRIELERQQVLVSRLRDAVGASSGGVAGLERTLQALFERRVETLLISDSYEAPGWRCNSCGSLALMGPNCKLCSSKMHQYDDIVEQAMEDALKQSCRVLVCENADLDVAGRIGALLRF